MTLINQPPLPSVSNRIHAMLSLPDQKCDLDATVVSRTADEGLLIEEVSFTADGAHRVPGIIARPARFSGTLPALICLHGTAGTKELLTAREFSPEPPPRMGWAREWARRGFLTLSIDQRGFAARSGNIFADAIMGLLNGQPYMGGLVWDVVRSVDYLMTREDVDPRRIGCTGFSLGGGVTWFAAAYDHRIAVAAPICGGLGSYRDLIDHGMPLYHSTYFYPPQFFRWFPHDQAELLAGVAPRPLLVVARTEDTGMPIQGVRRLEAEVAHAYWLAGAPDGFGVWVTEGGHTLTKEMVGVVGNWFCEKFFGC